jgi:glucuronoarabinoxylan endo-1,4-beta-xylanase
MFQPLRSAKAMKAAGTPLYAVSPQNESDLGWVKYDAKAMALWVGKYLGPTMAAQAPEVKVMGSETCNWWGLGGYEPVLMADANVAKYASIIATHLYGGTMKAYPDIQKAGKEFWQTEIYDSKTDVEDVGIVSGLRIAKMIHEGLTIANFNAWHFWWIKPCSGCANGALWAESTKQPTKRLWVMGNWSKFVRPGFVRIDVPASPASGVSLTAFRDSALTKVVVVAVNSNSGSVSQDFSIPGATLRSVTAHITDGSRNIAAQAIQNLSSSNFNYVLPAQSVTTLVIATADAASIAGSRLSTGAISAASMEHGLLKVDFAASEGQPVTVDLFDLDGVRLMERSFPAGSGTVHHWSTSVSGFAKGVYVVGIKVVGRNAGQIKILNRN